MKFWVSCAKFTVQVDTDRSCRITHAAPIVKRFIGQDISRLTMWAQKKFGPIDWYVIRKQ